jgi:hypothetical protein
MGLSRVWPSRLAKPAEQLVLPLDCQRSRAEDKHPVDGFAELHLLDEQARHDGLAGAGIVGEQEAQRLARQHRLVDSGDLVRQGLDNGGVNRQHRVEQIRQPDAVSLGDKAELRAVAVEPPAPVQPAQAVVAKVPLARQASEFMAENWRWVWALLFLPIAAWAWAWHAHRSAYDEAGLPRGPRL